MMNECFNPQCRKPLHYLREGRVFVFGVKSDGGNGEPARLEHYWLCGACAQTHGLAQDEAGIRMVKRNQVRWNRERELVDQRAMAS